MTTTSSDATGRDSSSRPDTAAITGDEAILWDQEERFWTGGADSARRMTAKDAVFVFPYPAGILQGNGLWREKDVAQRWRSIDMHQRYLKTDGNIAVLAYHVSAERKADPIYDALCISTYIKDGADWLRLTHQQTPKTPGGS